MTDGRRLRARLDAWFEPLVVGLFLLAAIGGWLTYGAHVAPQTTTEERVVSSWTLQGSYDHSARVTRENPVFPVGTTVSNRSVYLLEPTPVLNGTLRLRYDATGDGSLDAAADSRLVVRSVVERNGEETKLWRRSRPLANRSVASVAPDESVAIPVTVNVNRTLNRTDRIQSALGDTSGEIRLAVVTTVRLTGTIDDRSVNVTERYTLPIRPRDDSYGVATNESERTFERTETITVRERSDPIVGVGGPLTFAIGFLGVLALAAARARNDIAVSETERERLAFDREREEFDEWITAVALPSAARDRPRAEAASLADLVDVAVDTEGVVIEAPDEERYTVLHDGFRYVYEPPTLDRGGDPRPNHRSPTRRETTPDDGEAEQSRTDDQPTGSDAA